MPETRDPTYPLFPNLLIEDSMVVTYLRMKGNNLTPMISRDDPTDPRVGWSTEGLNTEKVENDMREYYNDIALQTFVTMYKAVKSEMYNMKRIRR